jgi:hypothetical protein
MAPMRLTHGGCGYQITYGEFASNTGGNA